MSRYFNQLTPHKNFSLKDLILEILSQRNSVLTLNEILDGVKRSETPYYVDKKIIRRLINKLAKKGLLEYVYVDLSYGVRLVDYHFSSFNIEAVT